MRSTCRATAGAQPLPHNSLQSWADDLAEALPDNATLLGWSLGGQVAMRAALDHPHKISRLILLAATPRFVAGDGWEHGMAATDLQEFGEALMADPQATLLRFLSLQTRGMAGQKAMLQQLRQTFLAAPQAEAEVLASGLDYVARHRFAPGAATAEPTQPRHPRHP